MEELQFLWVRGEVGVEPGEGAGFRNSEYSVQVREMERLFFACLRNSSKGYSKGMAYLDLSIL